MLCPNGAGEAVARCGYQVHRKIRHWHIAPREENVVPSPIEIHSLPVPPWNFVVDDYVADTEPNNEPIIEKSDTEIDFLALMNSLLSIASELKKHITSQSIGCSAKGISDPDGVAVRSLLKHPIRLLGLKIGNCDRCDARTSEQRQSLPDNMGAREFGVIINRKDDFT